MVKKTVHGMFCRDREDEPAKFKLGDITAF
jgi:hypothetical protein